MVYISLSNRSIIELHTLRSMEEFLIKRHGLEEDSFSVSVNIFSDGTMQLQFHHPTDLDETRAMHILEGVRVFFRV